MWSTLSFQRSSGIILAASQLFQKLEFRTPPETHLENRPHPGSQPSLCEPSGVCPGATACWRSTSMASKKWRPTNRSRTDWAQRRKERER